MPRSTRRIGALISYSFLAGMLAMTVPAPVLAQAADTGAVLLEIVDPDGAPVAGAAVTLTGSLGPRNGRSDDTGRVWIPGLPPGTYVMLVETEGFATVVRSEVTVTVGDRASLRLALQPAGVEEQVLVVDTTPMIDTTGVEMGATYGAELIERLPTASGVWAGILDHVPGVVLEDVDVGGGESGQQVMFSARGSGWDQNVFQMNGANTTDPDALGASSGYYSVNAFEEVEVTTGAHDIEIGAPGVALNMVTKSGSNRWAGGARFYWEDGSFVGDNLDDDLRQRGAGEGSRIQRLVDLDLQLGGPVVRDRLWFFADYWRMNLDRNLVGFTDEIDDTLLTNWTFNTSWRISDGHDASLRFFTSDQERGNHGASSALPPPSAWAENSRTDIYQLQYQGVLGGDTFVDARYSRLDKSFTLEAKDSDSPAPHPDFTGTPLTIDLATGQFSGGPFTENSFERDRDQWNVSAVRYVSGRRSSHTLKVGGSYERSQSFAPEDIPFGQYLYTLAGEPFLVELWNSAPGAFDRRSGQDQTVGGRAFGLFAQDTLTLGNRLTFNGGVRYDRSKTFNPPQTRLDSRWCGLIPEAEFGSRFCGEALSADDPTTRWSDFNPRVSLAYDLSNGAGSTVIKAGWGRYSHQQGATWARQINRNTNGSNTYLWADDGDGVFQPGENAVFFGGFFPGYQLEVDPDLQSPVTTEYLLGIERELAPNLSLGATFLYRETDNIVETVEIGIPYGPVAARLGVSDSYTPREVVDPGPDGRLGTADDGGTLTIWEQNRATFGRSRRLLTHPEDWGFDSGDFYRGVSLVLRKRWSGNWQLLGSWDIGRTESTTGVLTSQFLTGVFDNPNSDINARGLSPWDRTHVVKISGSYLIPGPGISLGAFVRHSTGRPLVRDALFRGVPQGVAIVKVAPPGKDTAGLGGRLPSSTIVDLRADKQFTLAPRWGTLHAYVDAFNVFNENAVTAARTRSGFAYGRLQNIVAPRVFRLGAAWVF